MIINATIIFISKIMQYRQKLILKLMLQNFISFTLYIESVSMYTLTHKFKNILLLDK